MMSGEKISPPSLDLLKVNENFTFNQNYPPRLVKSQQPIFNSFQQPISFVNWLVR